MGGEREADTDGIEMGASADLLSGADRPRSSAGWFSKQLAAAGTNRSRFRRSVGPRAGTLVVGGLVGPEQRGFCRTCCGRLVSRVEFGLLLAMLVWFNAARRVARPYT